MKVLGLCGTSGSGKSTVARILSASGIYILDADKIYSELIYPNSPLLAELAEQFGNNIIKSDGNLDRKALAAKVFSDSGRTELLPKLNSITHRAVLAEVLSRIEALKKAGARAVVFDAPLLFECGFENNCDKIISVTANRDVRLARIVSRDGISTEEAEKRIDSQMSDLEISQRSDYNIINNGTEDELKLNVKAVLKKIFE